MPDFTLYLGGTRSGKSARAEEEATGCKGPVLYVATARLRPNDKDMERRILAHKKRRPAQWHTLECPFDLAGNIRAELERLGLLTGSTTPAVLIDCVTMWVTNILCALPDPADAQDLAARCEAEVQALTALMELLPCRWIAVSGETGLGGIHTDALTRSFCDALGLTNQLLAAKARRTWFCVAGKKLLLDQ